MNAKNISFSDGKIVIVDNSGEKIVIHNNVTGLETIEEIRAEIAPLYLLYCSGYGNYPKIILASGFCLQDAFEQSGEALDDIFGCEILN